MIATVIAAGLAAPQPVAAQDTQTFAGEYTVFFLGLPVARSKFSSTFEGQNYTINGSVSSAGLAQIFDSTTGTSATSGRFVGKATQSGNFSTRYKSGKKNRSTTIAFSGGTVTKTVNEPPLRKRKRQVPLNPADLKAVSDPVSASLIRADSPQEVCARTLKVYDGEIRVNLALSQVSTGPVSGFDGQAVTCAVKFIPVSGYRTDSKSLEYLKNRAKIAVSFAQLGDTGIYAPVRASISTTMGPVTVIVKRTQK